MPDTDAANGFEPTIVAFFCNWCTYLAADLAVNSILGPPPDDPLLREFNPIPFPGRAPFERLPSGKSVEWYYSALRPEDDDEQPENDEGTGDGEGAQGSGEANP